MNKTAGNHPAFFQANATMQPSVPMHPLYIMYPDALPKPPQKRRKLLGTGDKNGGEKLRVFTRLKGFRAKESLVWTEITRRFGNEIKHGELLSIAEVVAANAGVQLDRDAKRRKSVLIKWFEENWFQISPYLNYVILEDKKNQNNGMIMPSCQVSNTGAGTNMIGFSSACNLNNSQLKALTFNQAISNNSIQNNFHSNSMFQQNNLFVNNSNNMHMFQNNIMNPNPMNFNSNNNVNDNNNNNIAQNIINSFQIQNWMQNQNHTSQPQNNFQMFNQQIQMQNSQKSMETPGDE